MTDSTAAVPSRAVAPTGLTTMPRDVIVALAGDDPDKQRLLAAWDLENELRHAAEEKLAEVDALIDTLRRENLELQTRLLSNGKTPFQPDRLLTLRKSDGLPDWYVIEWVEHDGTNWSELTSPHSSSWRCASRPSDADIEGTSEEMLAIAEGLERQKSVSFRRCACEFISDHFELRSPRNSTIPAVITRLQATCLAAEIRAALAASAKKEL